MSRFLPSPFGMNGQNVPRLEAVDPVDGIRAAVELERGGEQLAAEPLCGQLRRDEVHRRHLILDLRVVDDHPLVAEAVGLPLDLGARRGCRGLEELLDVGVRAVEVAARERLEDHGCLPGRLQAELGVERDGRGREREEPVVLAARRASSARRGRCGDPRSTCSAPCGLGDRPAHLARDLGECGEALLERRMIHEELTERRLDARPG